MDGRIKRALNCTLVVVAALLVAVTVAAAAPPPGATARCVDGSYSYSQHRSGTCSHHGGVAQWLSGGGGSATSTAPALSAPAGSTLDVGVTVLLAKRTKSAGCRLGANPDRRCSPGAYYSKLTKSVICSASFRTSTIRNVPEAEKFAVEREYGLAAKHYGQALEIDHIVSLELGGSNEIANLFPQKLYAHPGYRIKDKLENAVHDWVCDGKIGLRAAQQAIASNWQSLYETRLRHPAQRLVAPAAS